MSETTNLADASVTIEGKTYSMLTIPDANSELVKGERERVLRNIDLEKLVHGLEQGKDLLYLAYNGVAGFGALTAAMTKLHDNFGKLCGKCEIELGNIERQSGQILSNLKLVFTFLLRGKEKSAIEFLQKCGTVAAELSQKSLSLSNEFDSLGNETVAVLANTQVVQGQQLDNKKKLDQEVQELEGKTAKAKALVEHIAEQKKKLESLYQEVKEKSETAENRAFAMAIVGAILKPIGEGLGVFAAVYSGGAANAAANKLVATPPSVPPTKATAEKDAESKAEKLKEAEDELQAAEKAKEKADNATETAEETATEKEKAAEAAKEKADKKPSDRDLEAAAKLAESEAKDAKEKADKAKKEAKKAAKAQEDAAKKVEALKAAVKAAGEAVKEAGAALANMGDSYTKIAEGYRKEKQEYLKMLMEKQDLERDALSSIQEYAVRMKNAGAATQTVELTCASLFQAIGALKQVAVVLRLASYFWMNMATACEALAKSSLKAAITAFADFEPEERLKYFTDNAFKEQVVRYYAGWKAIEVVSKEYSAATNKIMTKVHADFKQNLPVEEARKFAIQLGEKLAIATEAELATNGKEKDELTAELDATKKLAA